MKNKKRILIASVLMLAVCLFTVFAVLASAGSESDKPDAMSAIETAFSNYKIGNTVQAAKDEYVSIAPMVSTYYDTSYGVAVPDYKGTQMVIYVVNTNTERVGTKTDVEIIQGMLDRGYIVSVLDYQNHKSSDSPNIDWSTQIQRTDIFAGEYITDNTYLPKGSYYDNYVVPAGYDVSPYMPFWETDKHGAEGSLERIVENWNTDFRKTNQEVVIPWVDENGNRKSTQNDFSANSPVWYADAEGKTVDNENGIYTKVKWTLAKEIYDCVDPDGKELDLTLYMHIVYPTSTEENPIANAPILANANSSGHVTTAKTSADIRPMVTGGMFNGYVGVVYDYLWFPMARSEHYGYYDGNKSSGGYTYDQMNYSLHLYNDKKINTAAMRYLRYLALSESDTYKFDTDAIGVYGNSKGSWITFLGNPELKEYTSLNTSLTTAELEALIDERINDYISRRQFPGHSDETRYQVGEANVATKSGTKNGITIDAGELQPWLTYEGKEILANANFLYPCCGPMTEDMVEGHAPMFASMNLQDNYNSAYGSSNDRAILMKTLDIPSMAVIADVGHMYTYGPDQITGIDTYDAMFDFMGYYLKHDAVKVLYVMPLAGTSSIETDTQFVVKFTGPVDENEIFSVTVRDDFGNECSGTWSSAYGKTEWTFTPDTSLSGNMAYTLTVPAGITGDNGKGMAEDYVASYTTRNETSSSIETFVGERGTYYVMPGLREENISDVFLRFRVINEAANVAELYAVSGFDSENPDASSVGELVGTVNLRGAGYYEIDVTEHMESANGESTVFLLRAAKEISETTNEFISTVSKGKYVTMTTGQAPDGTEAIKIIPGVSKQYAAQNHYYYQYPQEMFTSQKLINGGNAIGKEDIGRRFTVTLKIYDTVTRLVNVRLNSATLMATETIDVDANIYNFYTEAGKWIEYSFEYVVYEPDFGSVGDQVKKLTLNIQPDGCDESPVYVSSLSVTETVTGIELDNYNCSVVCSINVENKYKAPSSVLPFTVGEGSYATLSEALAVADGKTIAMHSNYRMKAGDSFTSYESVSSVTLDMNGYRIYLDNELPLINAYARSNGNQTAITVKNGSISVNNSSLIVASGTAAGDGKTFNIAFENVYIYTSRGARITDFMLDVSSSAAKSKVNVSLVDTVLEVDTKRLTKNPVKVLSGTNGTPDVTYTVEGGKFITDSFVRMTFAEDYRTVSLVANESGEYTKLYTSASSFVLKNIGAKRADGFGIYALKSVDGVVATYETLINPLATAYGIISDTYADVDLYPVLIFNKAGDFCKGYDKISGALNYFATYSEGDEWFIIVRKSLTVSNKYDNLSTGNGTVNVDLGNNVITLDGQMLYNADAKSNGDITVNTYNGTILADTVGVVRILGWNIDGYDISNVKNFDFNFENVTFGLADGATTSTLISYNYVRSGSSAAPANNAFSFTDCVFDITGATKATTLFTVGNLNGGTNVLRGTYDINGCEIIADNADYLDVYNLISGTDSAIYFNKGADGNYVKITVPTSENLVNESYLSRDEGLMEITGAEPGVYTLQKSDTSLLTPYGNIPNTYASLESYPWVVFKKTGTDSNTGKATYECIGGGTLFTTAVMRLATETAKDGAVIYLRADYNMQTAQNAAGKTYLGRLNGSLTIDLGNHTLTMGNGGSADAMLKCEPYANGYVTNVEVINGTIEAGADPLVRFCITTGTDRTPSSYYAVSSTDSTKTNDQINPQTFNVRFNGITINMGSGITSNSSLTNSYSEKKGGKANANVEFLNCDINVTNTSVSFALFKTLAPSTTASKAAEIIAVHAAVRGGNISIADVSKVTYSSYLSIGKLGSDTPTHKFGKNADGNYPTLTLSSGAMPTADVFTDADDPSITDLRFLKRSATVCGMYSVRELALETPYGNVPVEYAAFPWAVFKADKTFVTATDLFTTTASKQACLAGNGAVILLRYDFDFSTQAGGTQSLSTVNGTITIDLGGNTLSLGNSASKADAFIRCETYMAGYTTNIIVKNGTVLAGEGDPIVRFAAVKSRLPENYLTDCLTNPHNFNVTLDGLKIMLDPNHSEFGYVVLYTYGDVEVPVANNNLIVKDCDIDVSGCKDSFTLFASHKTVPAYVNVLGGTITYDKNTSITWQALNTSNNSNITYGKGSNGDYIVLTLPNGKSAPTSKFETSNGVYVFTKTASSGGYNTYKLHPASLDNTKVKTSITLYSDLVYNIFVLYSDDISQITLNGKTVLLSSLELEEIDGSLYYKILYDVAAADAAEDITLIVSKKFADEVYSGRWTLSIVKYSSNIISGEYSAVTDKLALDMLAYVKAAYVYFGSVGTVTPDELENALSRLDALLKDYSSEAVVDTEAVNDNEHSGINYATVILDSETTFAFYVDNAENASKYVFTQAGRVLDTAIAKDSKGTYIAVKTYAYAAREVITYSAVIDENTVYSGSYNLKSYYDYAKSKGLTNAVAVIEALWQYSVSAEAYYNEVNGIEN